MKTYILVFLVVAALVQTGLGGLQDMYGLGPVSAQHGWNDGIILMLLAILVAIVMK